MAELLFGEPIDGLLERLYAQHVAQNDMVAAYFTARAAEDPSDWRRFDERTNEFLKDKLIALERPKAAQNMSLRRHGWHDAILPKPDWLISSISAKGIAVRRADHSAAS